MKQNKQEPGLHVSRNGMQVQVAIVDQEGQVQSVGDNSVQVNLLAMMLELQGRMVDTLTAIAKEVGVEYKKNG